MGYFYDNMHQSTKNYYDSLSNVPSLVTPLGDSATEEQVEDSPDDSADDARGDGHFHLILGRDHRGNKRWTEVGLEGSGGWLRVRGDVLVGQESCAGALTGFTAGDEVGVVVAVVVLAGVV